MKPEELLELSPREIVTEIRAQKVHKDYTTYIDQYDPTKHAVHDTAARPKKLVRVTQADGTILTKLQDINRLSMPFQKIIVDRSAAFLIGEGIKFIHNADTDQENDMVATMTQVWQDNKLDYKTRQMARTWMSETEVAELWYFTEKNDKLQLRMQILAHSLGDTLYPYFDEYGDMTAFGREYKVDETRYFDLYTATQIVNYEKKTNWEEVDRNENRLGKIPIVYYTREKPEWSDVQPLIDRYETMLSNFADANDYFASPMVKVKGTVQGFAEKGEQGKIIQLDEGAEADYMTWDQAPAAIQLEKDTLQELIMSLSQTPDISFKQMQGVGNVAGIALKMMFLDAQLKCFKHQEEFGEGVQRRINLIKKGVTFIDASLQAAIDLHVEPEFTFYMPQNDQETVNTLVTATGGKSVMSRKTALNYNPYVTDVEKELEDINTDDAGQFGNIFDEV